MNLKRPEDVLWFELTRVESPAFAQSWVESNIPLNDFAFCGVDGLAHVLWDDLDHSQPAQWNEHTRNRLIERVGNAEVVLVHGLASTPSWPIFRRNEDHSEEWIVEGEHQSEIHQRILNILRYAVQSRGNLQQRNRSDDELHVKSKAKKKQKDKEEITVTNPRWEQVKGKDALVSREDGAKRPSAACRCDTIMLKVDVTGVGQGEKVSFDIYNASSAPGYPLKKRLRGVVRDGVGTAEWKLQFKPRNPSIEFDGTVRGRTSERGTVNFAEPDLKSLVKEDADHIIAKESVSQLRKKAAVARAELDELCQLTEPFVNIDVSWKKMKEISSLGDNRFEITDKDGFIDSIKRLYETNGYKLHSKAEEMLSKYIKGKAEFRTWNRVPGLHAEVRATNAILWDIPASHNLKSIQVSTFRVAPTSNNGTQGEEFGACPNCTGIISESVTVLTGTKTC